MFFFLLLNYLRRSHSIYVILQIFATRASYHTSLTLFRLRRFLDSLLLCDCISLIISIYLIKSLAIDWTVRIRYFLVREASNPHWLLILRAPVIAHFINLISNLRVLYDFIDAVCDFMHPKASTTTFILNRPVRPRILQHSIHLFLNRVEVPLTPRIVNLLQADKLLPGILILLCVKEYQVQET